MAEQEVGKRVAIIREAVGRIVSASDPWCNEIRDELAQLPAKERTAFVERAGLAVAQLGEYIAGAVR